MPFFHINKNIKFSSSGKQIIIIIIIFYFIYLFLFFLGQLMNLASDSPSSMEVLYTRANERGKTPKGFHEQEVSNFIPIYFVYNFFTLNLKIILFLFLFLFFCVT